MTSATPIPIAYGPRHPIYDQPIPKNSGERLWLSRSTVPFIAMTMALFKPGITINGAPGPQARWGKNAIDLPPGQYQIEVHVKYLWRFGSATAVLPVQAGQQLEAYYRPPMVAFGKGALGPTPQSTPNIAVTIVIVVLALVVGAFLGVLPTLLLS